MVPDTISPLCTYMGRANHGKHPIRFLWNRSQATAHYVYLMLYPQGRLRDALNGQPELQAHVFEALKGIRPSEVISEGRVYGGGLHRVEPKELGQIPARGVLGSIDVPVRVEQQKALFPSDLEPGRRVQRCSLQKSPLP
jgi:hypothetical protein